jgi:ABC-type microcin C transport system duplicated ATPase subunit YejF
MGTRSIWGEERAGSRGQLAMIDMALENDLELWIDDEPTGALDVAIHAQIL